MSSQSADTSIAILNQLSVLIQEYTMERENVYFEHGGGFDGLFKPSEKLVTSDGIRFPLYTAPMDGWRASDDIMAEFGDSEAPTADKLHYRISRTPANNDFTEVHGSAQISDIDLELEGRDIDQAAADFVPTLLNQMDVGKRESYYRLMNIPRSGLMGRVDGSKKAADKKQYEDASAYSSGSQTARVKVDGGAIGLFRRNQHIEFRAAGGTMHADNVRITDVNTVDGSIAITTTAKTTQVNNLNSIADNSEIFMTGERNKAMKGSLPEWFPESVSAGEKFFEDRDRSLPANYYLLPVQTRIGSSVSPTRFNFDMITEASRAKHEMNHGKESVNVAMSNTELMHTILKDARDRAQVTAAVDRGDFKLGGRGVQIETPELGTLTLMADPGFTPNVIRLLDLQTWRRLSLFRGGIKMMPGTHGIWSRVAAANGQGGSKHWRTEAYGVEATGCMFPEGNASIHNVTPEN